MGQKLKGSVTKRDKVWDASVPRVKGAKERVTCTFPTEEAANAWKEAQVERLECGLPALAAAAKGRLSPRPARTRRHAAGAGPDFMAVVEQLARQDYDILRKGGPERKAAVLAIARKHLAPAFGGRIPYDAEAAQARAIEWIVASAGRRLAPDDLPARYRLGLEPIPPAAKPAACSTMTERLKVLRSVLCFAQLRDVQVVDFAMDLRAQEPVGKCEKVPKLLTFSETKRIAGQLHVVHQLTLWLVRILGPRLSEPFGILVGDFIDDEEIPALLLQAQGGRRFALWGDELGEVLVTHHRQGGKTEAAYRLVGLPRQLAALVKVVIAAFHTDPVTGEVDLFARLIPVLRAEGGGQAAFRSAFGPAAERGGIVLEENERLFPHGQRAAVCSDFARDPAIDEFVARRWAGHRAADDVHGRRYVRDLFVVDDLLPAVRSLERRIDEEVGESLMVPTTRRPSFSAERSKELAAHCDAVLAEAGWQLDKAATPAGRGAGDPLIDAAELAALLGFASVPAARRLLPRRIAAEKVDGAWRVRLSDALAYRDRFSVYTFLEDLIEETGRTYDQLYRLLGLLGIETEKDDYSRMLLLTEEQVRQITTECRRVDALHERAVPISVACRQLGVKHTSIPGLVAQERLQHDPETNTSGWKFITKASLETELAGRGRRRPRGRGRRGAGGGERAR